MTKPTWLVDMTRSPEKKLETTQAFNTILRAVCRDDRVELSQVHVIALLGGTAAAELVATQAYRESARRFFSQGAQGDFTEGAASVLGAIMHGGLWAAGLELPEVSSPKVKNLATACAKLVCVHFGWDPADGYKP